MNNTMIDHQHAFKAYYKPERHVCNTLRDQFRDQFRDHLCNKTDRRQSLPGDTLFRNKRQAALPPCFTKEEEEKNFVYAFD